MSVTKLLPLFGIAVVFLIVAATLMLVIIKKRGNIETKSARIRAQGFQVTAHLISQNYLPYDATATNSHLRSSGWIGTYQYEFNGIAYTYRHDFTTAPPDTILLYVDPAAPHKPVTENQTVVGGKLMFLLLIPAILFFIFMIIYLKRIL